MLADAYPSIFLLTSLITTVIGLLLAIAIEIPLLSIMWRRPAVKVAGTIASANLLSALCGLFPVLTHMVSSGPGLNADAWDVHLHYWHRHFQTVA